MTPVDAVLEHLGVGGFASPTEATGEVLVDATALDSDHRTRGIGRYVRGLLSGFDALAGGDTEGPTRRYLRLGGPLQTLFGPHGDAASIAGSGADIDDRRTVALNRPPGPHLTRWLINEWRLADELAGACRLFHATEPAAICTGDGYKTVATMHDVIPLMFPDVYMQFPPYLFWPLYYRRLADEGRWAEVDHFIAISEATKRHLREYLAIPPERVTVVHNGIDHDHFRPVEDRRRLAQFRREVNLPDRFVTYLGADDYRKNVDLLVRALPHLPEGVDLVLAGGMAPGTRRRLEALARELRVGDRLVFPGYIADEHVPDLYGAASAFAYPSRAEGFGLQLLEAMAVGCPVVASDVGSLAEVVGDAGLLVDPNDPKAFGEALARCVTDDQLRTDLERRGRERAADFSWRRCAEETLEVYREVLDR